MKKVKRNLRLKPSRGLGAQPRSTKATPDSRIARALRLRQGKPNPYATFLGSVPAEEMNEDFARAIDAMN